MNKPAIFALPCAYACLAGQPSSSELAAAAVALAGSWTFAWAARREGTAAFSFQGAWWRHALPVLKALLVDSMRVGLLLARELLRPPRDVGRMLSQPFDIGVQTPGDAARRALVALGTCIAPNRFVLRIVDESRSLMVHDLARGAVKNDREWPL